MLSPPRPSNDAGSSPAAPFCNHEADVDAAALNAASVSRPALSLTHKTARGFAWVTGDALISKTLSVLSQMALTRLLLPDAWGLVGLAYTVSTFADLIAAAGFREVLVQRSRRAHLWTNPAIWLSIVFGVFASATMIALAPVAGLFYDSERLPGLILVLAAGSPFASAAAVPEACLRSQMRFRALSVLNSARVTSNTVLTVILAATGFGAYSFVIPRPLTAAAYTFAVWAWARPPMRPTPQIRRWRFLLSDTTAVLMSSVVLLMIGQAGFVVLGRMYDEQTVGYYFFAYNLSLQVAILLGLNLAGVLFPALATLQDDPRRQLSAFVRATRLLAAVGIPLCFVQVAVAGPMVKVLFGERMVPAIPLLAILNLGMGFHVLWNPTRTLLQSSGRFGLLLALTSIYAAIFIPAVFIGALFWQALGVAAATAAIFAVIAPLDTYIAVRQNGGGWREVGAIYALPTILGAIALFPLAAALQSLPAFPGRDWLLLIAIPTLGLMLYVWLFRRWMPDLYADLARRLRVLTTAGRKVLSK